MSSYHHFRCLRIQAPNQEGNIPRVPLALQQVLVVPEELEQVCFVLLVLLHLLNICYLSEGSNDTLISTNVSELQFVNYGVFQYSVTFTSDIFLFV
jgi:hypothetical protein